MQKKNHILVARDFSIATVLEDVIQTGVNVEGPTFYVTLNVTGALHVRINNIYDPVIF